MRFAKPSSTEGLPLLAGFGLAAAGALVALWAGNPAVALVGVGFMGLAAVLVVFHVLLRERRRHEEVEGELAGQAHFLEAVVDSFGTIAATPAPDAILELARLEAERLFDASAAILPPGEQRAAAPAERVVVVPLRVRGEEIGALRLVREAAFERGDVARAAVLADFAARVYENARLRADAEVREAERARLSEQLVTAEQDERRRLALYLHDTSVQSLSGIALMLDAVLGGVEGGSSEEAKAILPGVLERLRKTIGDLRDLSFNLEPVVLRDQGLGPAVRALAEQLGLDRELRIEVALDGADSLAEKAQAALYQIIREAMHGAVRRSPTRIAVDVRRAEEGGVVATVADDGHEERRRSFFDGLAERARTLNGTFTVEQGADGGTAVRVTLPPYAAER